MDKKRNLMMGVLMLSSIIFLGSCEEGTVKLEESSKDSNQGSTKGSNKVSSKDSNQGPIKISKLLENLEVESLEVSEKSESEKSKLPEGGEYEVVGGGYAVAIGEVDGSKKMWLSEEKDPRVWTEVASAKIKNAHLGKLPASLKKSFPSRLIKISSDGKELKVTDEDGDIWTSSDNGVNWGMEEFAGGDGTSGDPFKIASAAQLWMVRNHLTNHFQLSEDLDLSEAGVFYPIGDATNQFIGTFDGNGKRIASLTIKLRGQNLVGFFGALGEGGVLKNIVLEDIDVDGHDDVGGLVGFNQGGKIQKSAVTGNLVGVNRVGGLVGFNAAKVDTTGVIKDSNSYVNVRGSSETGGLVGRNQAKISNSQWGGMQVVGRKGIMSTGTGGLVGINSVEGEVKKSGTRYATGVSVSGPIRVGGLVGYNLGDIGASYSTIEVRGAGILGGLVGQNEQGGRIKNSYATGNVKDGKGTVGGLVGWNKGTIKNTFAWGRVERIASRDYIGGLVGKNESPFKSISGKNYWRHSKYGVGKLIAEEIVKEKNVIKSDNFKDLNADNTGWLEDVWEFGGGYNHPELKWKIEASIPNFGYDRSR